MLRNERTGLSGRLFLSPRTWQTGYVFGVFILFGFQLLFLLVPQRVKDLHEYYGLLVIGGLTAVYLTRKGVSDGWGIRLVLLWAAWVLVSRWLNRDFYLMIDRNMVTSALYTILFLSVGLKLDAEGRERFLRWFTLAYAGFFLLACLAAVFVALTDTYLHIPPENIWITILDQAGTHPINVLSTHRLMTAERFYIAWALLLLCFFRTRKNYARVALVLGMLVLHVGISLCYSRNVQICFSISCGMLAFLLCWRHFEGRKVLFRGGLSVLLLAVLTLAAFESYPLCNRLMSGLHQVCAPRFEAYYSNREPWISTDDFGLVAMVEDADNEGTDPSASRPSADGMADDGGNTPNSVADAADNMYAEHRTISGNVTLSERTYIWKSIIPAIQDRPSILLRGQPSKNMMAIQNQYINTIEYKTHMHNAWLQTLMLTGLPGLFCFLAWTVLVLLKMLRCWFGDVAAYPLKTVLYVIPLAGVFVFNLVEVSIFGGLDISGMAFLVLAGLFLAEMREIKTAT